MFEHGIWVAFIVGSHWPGYNYYIAREHATKCSYVGADVSGHVKSKLNSTCQLFRVLQDWTKGLQHEPAVSSLKSLLSLDFVLSFIHVSYFLTYVIPRDLFPEFKLPVLSTTEICFCVIKIYGLIVLRNYRIEINPQINLKNYSFVKGFMNCHHAYM
jgi:hypothetical protein